MAHIAYNRSTPYGAKTSTAIARLIAIRQDIDRIKLTMDSLTAGGVTLTNLEIGDGAANFGVPAGQGATFYNDIVSIKSGLAAIAAATIADMDLGESV